MQFNLKVFVILACHLFNFVNGLHPNVGLDVYEIITKHGFSYEKHPLTTPDGYILETIRLLPTLPINGNSINASNPPILLVHGLQGSAETFVTHYPDKALAFILCRQGYDVWLFNQRGSRLGRKHLTLDPDLDAEQFFDFTVHEISLIDVRITIDYILETTGYDKLSYIGFSQGGSNLLILLAEKPEYNKKIKIAITMAAVGIIKYTPNSLIRFVSSQEKELKKTFDRLKIYEAFKHGNFFMDVAKLLSDDELGLRPWVENIMKFFNLMTSDNVDPELFPSLATSSPNGGSWNQFMHFMQCVTTGNFQRFDYYNETKNMEKYGTKVANVYDLRKVTAKFVMFYSKDDGVVGEKDTELMAKLMKNAVTKMVPAKNFAHPDFVIARGINELVYNDVLEDLKTS